MNLGNFKFAILSRAPSSWTHSYSSLGRGGSIHRMCILGGALAAELQFHVHFVVFPPKYVMGPSILHPYRNSCQFTKSWLFPSKHLLFTPPILAARDFHTSHSIARCSHHSNCRWPAGTVEGLRFCYTNRRYIATYRSYHLDSPRTPDRSWTIQSTLKMKLKAHEPSEKLWAETPLVTPAA